MCPDPQIEAQRNFWPFSKPPGIIISKQRADYEEKSPKFTIVPKSVIVKRTAGSLDKRLVVQWPSASENTAQ